MLMEEMVVEEEVVVLLYIGGCQLFLICVLLGLVRVQSVYTIGAVVMKVVDVEEVVVMVMAVTTNYYMKVYLHYQSGLEMCNKQ